MTRSVAKKRSATSPTKNGDTSEATDAVPKTAPAAVAEKCSVVVRYVVIVTYHAPQITYWRNIMAPRRVRRNVCIGLNRTSATIRIQGGPAQRQSQ